MEGKEFHGGPILVYVLLKWALPGDPVVCTLTAKGPDWIPGKGTKILQATWPKQVKKKKVYIYMCVCVCMYVYNFWASIIETG